MVAAEVAVLLMVMILSLRNVITTSITATMIIAMKSKNRITSSGVSNDSIIHGQKFQPGMHE